MTVSDYIATQLPKMRRACNMIAYKFFLNQDDHFQDCLINAIRQQHTYVHESDSRFFAWWGRLCYNHAIDQWRKRKNVPPMVDAAHAAHVPGSRSRAEGRQELAGIYWRIRRAFRHPKVATRNSLIMYLTAQGYQYEDVSKELRIPLGTVRSIIHRCRTVLTKNPTKMSKNNDSNSVNRVNQPSSKEKNCRGKCKKKKPMEDFHRNKNNKDGRQDICKECQSDFMRDYNARKAMERKAQLTAADIQLDPAPAPKVEVSTPATRRVKLPDKKVAKQAEKADSTPREVNLPVSTGKNVFLTPEDLSALNGMLIENRDMILKKLDGHIATIDRIIKKLR